MKLPSFQHLVLESSETFKRFPLAILSGLTGSLAAVWLLNLEHGEKLPFLVSLMETCGLGISLFIAIEVFSERRSWALRQSAVGNLVGMLLLAAYFVSLPSDLLNAAEEHIVRLIVLAAGLHFLVAFAPFTRKGEINGFWQFNKALFLRFSTAFLYSGVLFAGLAVALLAADNLLGIDIPDKRYPQLWVILAGVFNTWFFLSCVPRELQSLEQQTAYPKGLKIFTQYVLIPLVVIYVVILYLYLGKIIIEWNLPKGWVANLVLGFSITGILSLLLVYPVRNNAENIWLRVFSRWYYVALIPLVVLLMLSISLRISEYGITENRYFVFVLGLWLAGIVAYMLLSKAHNIKVIPISLCIIAFLSAYGPFSAFNVSQSSQVARLESLLAKNNLLVDGKIKKATSLLMFDDMKEVSSIVRYLVVTHGEQVLQELFTENDFANVKVKVDSVVAKERHALPKYFVEAMGLTYTNEWEAASDKSFLFTVKEGAVLNVSEFEHSLRFVVRDNRKNAIIYTAGETKYNVRLLADSSAIMLSRSDVSHDSLLIDLMPTLRNLFREGSSPSGRALPIEQLTVEATSSALNAVCGFESISGKKTETGATVTGVAATIVVRRK